MLENQLGLLSSIILHWIIHLILQGICLIISNLDVKKTKYENKKILIIGGTSGLGLSLALKLSEMNDVTVSGRRDFDTQYLPLEYLKMDVTKEITFSDEFDVIFYCTGYANVKRFDDLKIDEFRDQFEVNYFGVVKTLKCLLDVAKRKKKPVDFVMIGSTLTFFSIPGYSAYSPSKSALFDLFSELKYEMRSRNIFLYFYILSSTKTPGYDKENRTKPFITKKIENLTDEVDVDSRADTLLAGMKYSHTVSSDNTAWLLKNIPWNLKELINGLIIRFYMFYYSRIMI